MEDEKLVRVITTRDEIILMMCRLVIDVLENPILYKARQGHGATEFYEGENHRRALEGREKAYLEILRDQKVISGLNAQLL